MILDQILNKSALTKEEIVFLLNLTDQNDQQRLFDRADEVRAHFCGDEIHLRGIIEFSIILFVS